MSDPWSESVEQTVSSLNTDQRTGLSSVEAKNRLEQFGPNRLVTPRNITFWDVVKEEIREPMIMLLFVVGIVYSIWGEIRDAITIFVIIFALVFVEIYTEYRAKKGVAALRKLSQPTVPVIRQGAYQNIVTEEIVKGDILVLETGEIVPADIRVINSIGLQVNESALTGESAPVAKFESVLPQDTPLTDRSNMVFAGTTITRGHGLGIVTATGMETQLGKITGLITEGKQPKTTLQLAMKQLAGFLVWVAVAFSVLIPVVGLIQGKPLKEMILTGLSLSFATIPEELPIIITMVLGVGALALSRKNVLIRRLNTAEILGDVTTIVTDKTGTITENNMTLARIATDTIAKSFTPGDLSPADIFLVQIGLLTSCSKATAAGCHSSDPMEAALIEAAGTVNIVPDELFSRYSLKTEFGFDNERKMMSTIFVNNGEHFIFAKGAPEVIMARSSAISHGDSESKKTEKDQQTIEQQVENMANEAMRVIAFAYKKLIDKTDITQEEAEKDLVFVGLAGLVDPLRPGVVEAFNVTREAGVKIVIVSGDYPLTVQKIASQVGIGDGGKLITGIDLERINDHDLSKSLKDTFLFARTNPEQKLRIVKSLQSSGEIVAVTGDGINDAPALKSANIGIAMGETGTEVAREAAGMILADDSFSSVTAGIREGRKIFDNLKKGVAYYLSVKIALVLTFLVPLFLSISFPFSPIQIILLELFMDLAASATFVAEPIEPGTMKRPPRRPEAKFINSNMLSAIFVGSISLAAAVLINYLLVWFSTGNPAQAQSIAFTTWLIGHVFLAVTMRSHRKSLWSIGILSNKAMLVWAAAVIVFLALINNLPVVQASLKLTPLSLNNWIIAVFMPLLTILLFEIRKLAVRNAG